MPNAIPNSLFKRLSLLPLLFIAFLFIAANIFGIRELWGINALIYLPKWLTYLSICLLVLLSIPKIASLILDSINMLSVHISRNSRFVIIFPIVIAAMLLPLFLLFPSITTFLGDGHLRTNQLTFGRWFLTTEFLDFLLHAILYNYIFLALGLKAVQCYQVYSALCGVLFVIGVWRLCVFLRQDHTLITFLLILCTGITIQFFGYIESYSLIAALTPFVFRAGLESAENPKKIWTFVILCSFASLIHSIGFILFAPVLLFAVVSRRIIDHTILKKINSYFILITVSMLIIAYVLSDLGFLGIRRFLVPFDSKSMMGNPFFSGSHLLDILNWILLASLPAIYIAMSYIFIERRPNPANAKANYFLFWIILPSLIFLLFFRPQLGAPRDWDLFALPSFLLFLALATATFRAGYDHLPRGIIPVILISLILTASAVAINHSVKKSADRFADIIEIGKRGNLFKEYNLLSSYASDHPEISDKWLEFTLRALRQPPLNGSDSSLILNKLGEYYMKSGDRTASLRFFNLSLTADSLNLVTYQFLTNYYRTFGTLSNLQELAELLSARFPGSARGQMDAGILYYQSGDSLRGAQHLKKAFDLDSNNVFIVVNYAVQMLKQANFVSAVQLLNRATQMNPEYFTANYNLAIAYAGLGNRDGAVKYLSIASRLASNAEESTQVARLQHLWMKK